jgi:hypothetical protein
VIIVKNDKVPKWKKWKNVEGVIRFGIVIVIVKRNIGKNTKAIVKDFNPSTKNQWKLKKKIRK